MAQRQEINSTILHPGLKWKLLSFIATLISTSADLFCFSTVNCLIKETCLSHTVKKEKERLCNQLWQKKKNSKLLMFPITHSQSSHKCQEKQLRAKSGGRQRYKIHKHPQHQKPSRNCTKTKVKLATLPRFNYTCIHMHLLTQIISKECKVQTRFQEQH